jgi:MOSC domain-containing protein YiiM
MRFTVESVNISEQRRVQKHPVEKIECLVGHGIGGDAHAGNWHRQVSFLAGEAVDIMKEKLKRAGADLVLQPGAFAENIVTRGIDWLTVQPGGKIVIGQVVLEVTQIGKECHTGCAIADAAGECIMPKQGIFARVKSGGTIRPGDAGEYTGPSQGARR